MLKSNAIRDGNLDRLRAKVSRTRQDYRRVNRVARRRWKKESGYHRQGRGENTVFRYKSILWDRLHTRDRRTQEVEVTLGCVEVVEDLRNRLTTRERGDPKALYAACRALQGIDSKDTLHQLRETVPVK